MMAVAILEVSIKGRTMHHPFLVVAKVNDNIRGARILHGLAYLLTVRNVF